ncbi:hypothetical protein Kfla_5865 [Kribbella flavida DSM 17836]|uniref:Golgi phosphoprotein 3 n=1 Tax=Kribbella flavida (strain DSM 17836 / JCM 10339 / NBRC 14399) TaxID=479435 RepID=D2PRF1_KRIFD|nr:GPP34 family phosphoprotein [Kribbella flavida]ADB34869.1 hypothetical protein Kfla_5865 [Kribbella flavida DSM 17836]
MNARLERRADPTKSGGSHSEQSPAGSAGRTRPARPRSGERAPGPAERPRAVGHGRSALPDGLAARLYLLALDPATGKLASRSKLGLMLRAATLVDLQLAGRLADEEGRVVLATPRPGGASSAQAHLHLSPVSERMLAEIEAAGRKRWRYWVERHQRAAVGAVRDELVKARLIDVERYRRFGVLPAERLTLRQPLVRRHLLHAALDTLRPARLVTRVDLRDATLAVLAAAGDLRLVLPKEQRKRHKERLAQLAVRVGPVAPALRKALQKQAGAAAGG